MYVINSGSISASEAEDVLKNEKINTVFIATPHSHMPASLQVYNAGKNIFVEKPLAMSEEEL